MMIVKKTLTESSKTKYVIALSDPCAKCIYRKIFVPFHRPIFPRCHLQNLRIFEFKFFSYKYNDYQNLTVSWRIKDRVKLHLAVVGQTKK